MTISLHWFRRDLRVHDNLALRTAVTSSATTFSVFCSQDLESLNARQRAFVTGALRNLSASLGKSDASLSLLDGKPEDALLAAARRLHATKVFCGRALDQKEASVERAVATVLRSNGIELSAIGGCVVHEPELVAQRKQAPGQGYRVFPPFYDAWKALPVDRAPEDALPNGRDRDSGAVDDVAAPIGAPKPAERAALDVLARFVTARAGDYAANAEYPGRDATSHLAAYLRFGLISPRGVYRAVREKMVRSWTLAQERLSMESFLRRLALRDFFMHLAYYEPAVVDEPLQEKMRGFQASTNEKFVRAWQKGMTGYPLVDAAMRQLKSEGRVHQRAAVVAASFCIADLGLDWRLGRDTWMSELLAADAALCAGNWQRIAGIGSDQAAYPRIYNPVRQAQLFDSQATYVRRYCKELGKLPSRAALAPWALEKEAQVELGFFTPELYPKPIVEHDVAARAFLAKYQAYRNRADNP